MSCNHAFNHACIVVNHLPFNITNYANITIFFFLLKEKFIVTSHGDFSRYKGNNIYTIEKIGKD